MTLELSAPDDAPDLSAHDPSLLERIQTLETRAADATALDEVATRLDKVETRLARPSVQVRSHEDDAELERKAFTNWCRRGDEGLSDLEKKVLQAAVSGSPATDGFTLVPEVFTRELMRNLVEISPMRQVARVVQVSGNPVLLPKRVSNLSAQWTAETQEHPLSQPAYGQQSIQIFEARVSVEITNQLLEDAAFDMAAELARDFAEEFARLEGVAFVSGSGTTQPEGFLTSSLFETIGGGTTADALIDLFYSIPATYSSRGTWLMPRTVIGSVRKLKTAQGYLWVESLQPGQPASLLGRPVVEMPDLTMTGSPTGHNIAFGDWNRAYRIFDRVGLEILRDPYSAARRSIVTFHARKRVGGALVDGDAVKGLTQ